MRPRARSARSPLTSTPTVSKPACTHTCAIPAPMVPRPTTPTVRISLLKAGQPNDWLNSGMAVTVNERKLFVAGEWIETGDWQEVRSPYSGDVVGRVAKADAAETSRAIAAPEGAMED